MYSPKIADGLISPLYWLARERGIPMTRLVNDFIRQGLERNEEEKRKGPVLHVTVLNGGKSERAA